MFKRILCLASVLMICLCLCSAASAEPKDYIGRKLKDFTVKTIDGTEFTLSESLKTHKLVVLNLWATWCGPCRAEFPHLEKAWEKYKDKVDVIALSVEVSDSKNALTAFAKDYGLKFRIGRDTDDIFSTIGGKYIPTTLVIGQGRKILAVEVGSKSSVKAFTDWFDQLLPKE